MTINQNIIKKLLIILLITLSTFSSKAQLRGEVETEVTDSRFKLAQSYIRKGDYKAAEGLLAEVYQKDKSATVLYEYVYSLEMQKKYTQAIEIIEKQLKNEKVSSYTLNAILGKIYWQSGKANQAEEIWTKTIDEFKKNPYAYDLISDIQLALQLPQKSVFTLMAAKENMGLPYIFGDKIVKIFISTNNYKEGFDEIIKLFDYNKVNKNYKVNEDYEYFESLEDLIIYQEYKPQKNANKILTIEEFVAANNYRLDLNATKGRLSSFNATEECKEYFTNNLVKLSDKNANNVYVQDLYAWYLKSINSKNVYDVYIKLDKIKNSQGRTLLGLGDESQNDGNLELALKSYDYVIGLGNKSPNYQNAVFGSLQTKELIENNKINKFDRTNIEEFNKFKTDVSNNIIEKYRVFLKEYPNSNYAIEIKLKIANVYKSIEQFDLAQAEYEAIIKQYGKSSGIGKAYIELSDMFVAKNDLVQAEFQLDNLLKSTKLDVETIDLAKLKKADLLFYKGDITRADSLYQFLSNSTDKNISNDAIEANFLIQKNEDFVKDVIKFAKAKLLTLQQKNEDAIKLYLEINVDETEKDIAEISLIEIAKIKSKQGNYLEAIEYLTKVGKRNIYSTNNDLALLLIAKNQISLNLLTEALETLKTILNRYPDTIYLQEARDIIRDLRENS
ncbi:MAG: tetratricopeptide repeat protein [Candidatus Kapaibacteriota bacterium]